jgi:hypothetical protein
VNAVGCTASEHVLAFSIEQKVGRGPAVFNTHRDVVEREEDKLKINHVAVR